MNIKNVRIGNDILISWKIWIDQEGQIPFDFTDKTVKLMMKRGFKEWEMPIQIEGNTLFTTYYGKDQDQVGRHTLYLVINEGLPNMSTLDACIVINLINTTCQRNKKESCSEINVETISLSGDLSVDKIINLVEVDDQMSNTSENPVQNKVVKQYIDNKIPALNLGSAAYANVEDFEKRGSIENASTKLKEFINSKDFVTASELKKKLDELDIKVDLSDYLVSGVTIKTINKQSLLGSGNIQINPGLSVYVLKSLFYYDIVEAYNMQQSITIPENDLAYMRDHVGECVFLVQSSQSPDGPEYYPLNIRQDDADTYLEIYDASGVYMCDFPKDTLLPKVLLQRIDYGLPNGGLEGEVLTKRSNKLGDVEWRAPIIEDGSITLAKLSQDVQTQLESEIPYLYCSNNKWSGDYAAVSDALRQSLPYIILIKVNNENIQAVSAWHDSGKVSGYYKYYIEFKAYITEGSGIVEKTYRALDDSTKTVTEIDSQLISSAGGEEGGSIEVDSEMSDTSENPVQNKVVKRYVDGQSKNVAEALAYIADNVMPSQKEAQSGNVAVFDESGNVVDSGKSVEDFKGADGADGADGKDGADGVGVPAGGSAGQVLSKKSDEDFDTEWVEIPQGGGGTVDVVDNLTTADPTKALSANMGRTLNEKFQYKNYLAGKNLDQKGNILDADGWNVTTPIAVVGGTALTFECGGTNSSALCEYDANDNCIDYWDQSTHPRTITTKANTAYVRLAVPNSPMQDYFVAQNEGVLFNKLRKFDIVEQVANLEESTIEVTPLLSIENDIYPPHMRLMVEWSNEDAEVLQPVSYNAETDLFEVESMPSWLAEDNVIVPATINYSDTILWGTGGWQNVPFPKNNTQTVQHIKRVSATTFKALSQSVEASNQMDIIASPDCTLFSYCHAKDVQRLPLQLDGEELSGIKKFKIVIKDSNLQFGKTFCGINSSTTQLISNNYPRVLGTYLAETRPLMVSGYMIIEVDFDNARYRYLEYQLSGLSRTGAQTVTPYVQMSKNTEQWSSIWPNTKPISQAFFLLPANALTKKCNVKIYEIYE